MSFLKSLICLGALLNIASAVAQNTFPSSGNVGIGTMSPGNTLDVNGGIQTSQLNSGFAAMTLGDRLAISGNKGWLVRAEADANPWQGIVDSLDFEYWNGTNGTTPVTISAAGNVGIGTTSPLYPLQFGGFVSVEAGMAGSPWAGGVRFGDNSGWKFVIGRLWENTSHSPIDTGSTGSLMTVQDNGNVGIGTTNPQAKLELNGGLRFTTDGSVQTTAWTGVLCGGDYAEAVEAAGGSKAYEPGDVLVLASDGKHDVAKSSEPYSTLVAGIYATKPGVIGRRQSLPKEDPDLPMAMVGIVPTKVSAENGPIHRGDLLVSSSTPGFAMKGTDRSRLVGAVVGKAMGSLDIGTGVIDVLVTLQ